MAKLRDILCSKMTKGNLLVLTGAVTALALLGSVALSQTKAAVPKFEVDPGWPKPLPEGWITGRLGSVCVDSHDHVIVTNRRDRKSTRLNSSHVEISYAVFCLKK